MSYFIVNYNNKQVRSTSSTSLSVPSSSSLCFLLPSTHNHQGDKKRKKKVGGVVEQSLIFAISRTKVVFRKKCVWLWPKVHRSPNNKHTCEPRWRGRKWSQKSNVTAAKLRLLRTKPRQQLRWRTPTMGLLQQRPIIAVNTPPWSSSHQISDRSCWSVKFSASRSLGKTSFG